MATAPVFSEVDEPQIKPEPLQVTVPPVYVEDRSLDQARTLFVLETQHCDLTSGRTRSAIRGRFALPRQESGRRHPVHRRAPEASSSLSRKLPPALECEPEKCQFRRP